VDQLLEILKGAKIEVTGDLQQKLKNAWDGAIKQAKEEGKKDTGDLFTQEELDNIVKSRLTRERNSYESELKDLRGKMESLVDPAQVESVKTEFQGQLQNINKAREKEKIDYELRLAATKAGANDEDYIMFQVEKRGLKDNLGITEDGQVVVKEQKDDKGNPVGVATVIEGLKKDLPTFFGTQQQPPAQTPGPTTPAPGQGEDPTLEQRLTKSEQLAIEMGFKKKESDK